MQIPVGIIVDRIGVKLTMVFATAICAGSALLFAVSQGFWMGLSARMLMGFGSSFAFITLLVIVREWFPRKYFGFFAGLSQFVGTLGPILAGGPLVALLDNADMTWRTIIAASGLLGFGLTLLSLLFVRGKKPDNPDAMRFLLPKSPLKEQIVALLSNKQAWFVALYSALIYTAIATLGAMWGENVLEAKGLSNRLAGDATSVLWIGYALGCPITGLISDMLKRRKIVLIGLAILAFVATASLQFFQSGGFLLFATIFFMIGFAGGAQNVGFAMIVEKVSERLSATSMGLNNGLMLLFDTVNPILFGFLVTLTLKDKNSTVFDAENFRYALTYIPSLCLVALFVAIFCLKETYCKPQHGVVMAKL
jgi:MFS family permease